MIRNLESEAEREAVLQWWKELSSTRLNDPKRAAILVILQRLHEYDLAGEILSNSPDNFVHLCLPMSYEWRRHCVTMLGWQDPRGLDADGKPLVEVLPDGARVARDVEAQEILDSEREGALLWPERFGPADITRIKANLGPTLSAGRLQQAPQPRSGGLFKREWFLPWDPPDDKFPPCDLRIASVDCAFTTKQELDPSAMVVLGLFRHPDHGRPRVVLMHAWRKHLQMHGHETPRLAQEVVQATDRPEIVRSKNSRWKMRVGSRWGLVEWVAETCRMLNVHRVLVEGKASGLTAVQELRRLYADEPWSVQAVTPKGDKMARALAVQPLFARGMFYAPLRDWAEQVIDEMCMFPRGRYDDLTDAVGQGLWFLREAGVLRMDEEVTAEQNERLRPRSPPTRLYPC